MRQSRLQSSHQAAVYRGRELEDPCLCSAPGKRWRIQAAIENPASTVCSLFYKKASTPVTFVLADLQSGTLLLGDLSPRESYSCLAQIKADILHISRKINVHFKMPTGILVHDIQSEGFPFEAPSNSAKGSISIVVSKRYPTWLSLSGLEPRFDLYPIIRPDLDEQRRSAMMSVLRTASESLKREIENIISSDPKSSFVLSQKEAMSEASTRASVRQEKLLSELPKRKMYQDPPASKLSVNIVSENDWKRMSSVLSAVITGLPSYTDATMGSPPYAG
jgi:hypothetical protein